MKRVRELIPVAKKLDGFAFAKQMGPFVLIKHPTPPAPPKGPDWQTSTAPLPSGLVIKELEPVELPEMLIATLPPPDKDGSLQLVMGRAADSDVVVDDDPSVSQKHAAILWDGKSGLLRELGSANGTFLNGMRIGSRAVLRNGDQITVGRSTFQYLLTSAFLAKLLKVK